MIVRPSELEDKIDVYTDSHFNPSAAAQRFFAQYGEQEIAKKMSEMTKIQQDIETELKVNVKNNYPAFLEATEQIHQVGSEMSTLKHLIENTQKLIQDARSTRLSDARMMRSNSLLPAIHYRKAIDLQAQQEQESSPRDIPQWLTRAADELAQFIVEQQYQKAVTVVLKVRTFVQGLERASSSLKAQQVLEVVNSRCDHLAVTIKTSLLTLPHSPLWGSVEQLKRLKLLVSLGELAMAAEGFASVKRTHMQRALYSLDMTYGDPVLYAQALSRSFYTELAQCVRAFYQVFENNQERRQVAALIIAWIQSQVADYVRLLVKQLKLGVAETAALLVLHFRHLPELDDAPEQEEARPSRASLRRLSSVYRPQSAVPSVLPTTQGGLTLIANTLHVACHFCAQYQSQFNLTGSSSGAGAGALPQVVPLKAFVTFYAASDLQRLACHYIQHFINDVQTQVKQDGWTCQKLSALQCSVRTKGGSAIADVGGGGSRLVSASYAWLVSVLSHVLDEVLALLRGPDAPGAFVEASAPAYTHGDVVDMESLLCATFLRVLLCYVMEVESIDLSAQSSAQLLCLTSTLMTVTQCLLPSMAAVLGQVFVVEKMALLPCAPSVILKTVGLRVNRILADAQSVSN